MKYLVKTVVILLIAILPSLSVFSQTNDSIQSLSNFLDSLIPEKMAEMHVPGAVVSIVKDGKIIFNKGYGYADIKNERKVDPGKTTFRLASISKTFTALAIMKLVEEGKLELDADIRDLITGKYEFNWEYPMTIHHIMTHTTGLSYSSIGSHNLKDKSDSESKVTLPDLAFKPGSHFAYSNTAFGILGYLIEKISGQSYHQYLEENVLIPLSMVNSTFNTILPDHIALRKAETYLWQHDKQVLQNRQYLSIPAASSLESTGTDMANYMMALLSPETIERAGIVSQQTFEKMTSSKIGSSPNNSMGYGFGIGNFNNHTSIWHSGGVRGFLSMFNVFPESNLGVFISHNNRPGAEYFIWSINGELFDKLIPEDKADLSWVSDQELRSIPITAFAGTYKKPNHRTSTFEKGQSLLVNAESTIKVIDNEIIEIDERKFRRVGNTTFVSTRDNSERTRHFVVQNDNKVTKMMTGSESIYKIKWYQKLIFTQVITVLAFLMFLLAWILGVIRWFKSKKSESHSIPTFQRWINYTGTGYFLSFSILLVAYLIIETVKEGVPLAFKLPLIALTFFGILSLASPWALFSNYKSNFPKGQKVRNYISIASIVFVTVLFWNLKLIGMWW